MASRWAAAGLMALAAGAAEAGASGYFAAGFAGVWERTVLLSEADEVLACRAIGRLDDGASVWLERRREAERTILTVVTHLHFGPGGPPEAILVDGARYPAPGGFYGGDFRLELTPEAERALQTGRAAALDYAERVAPLPARGLAQAVAFAARCGLL